MIKRLELSARFGTALATREAARSVQGELKHLYSGDAQFVLDFTGISAMSPSFADELLRAVLIRNTELWVIGLSDELYELLRIVALRRNATIVPADGEPSSWRLQSAPLNA
jgi:hypothetical protein